MSRIRNTDGRLNHMVGRFCSTYWRGVSVFEIMDCARQYVESALMRHATREELDFAVQCADDAAWDYELKNDLPHTWHD